jgi:hypothetical protein
VPPLATTSSLCHKGEIYRDMVTSMYRSEWDQSAATTTTSSLCHKGEHTHRDRHSI